MNSPIINSTKNQRRTIHMNNITQNKFLELLLSHFSKFDLTLNNLAYPLEGIPSVFNYAKLTEDLMNASRTMILQILRDALEHIDLEYRNRPSRTETHYVKDTRERTMITMFGMLTYTRTVYVNRQSKEIYTHVDEYLGLPKYDRYDPCVKAQMAALYTYTNSMIKVGMILGQQIFLPFSTTQDFRDYAIPRQTVQKAIKDIGYIQTTFQRKKETPKRLYIMADEKWIPLQMKKMYNEKSQLMTRAVVIFEDCENVYKCSKLETMQRHRLTGKTRVLGTNATIWQNVEDALSQLYDIEQIDEIHLMGDGGGWIKAGVNELTNAHYSIDFTLDSFHLNQAILRMSSDKEKRQLIQETIMIDQDKKHSKLYVNH